MGKIPEAKIKHASYENIPVECPWCGQESIFNRASDLRILEPIAGLNVSCQSNNCGRPFRMVGDSVNCAHEMLILDCYELLERKHYMNCILTLAQAYEVFFNLSLRVELLYKPFARDIEGSVERLKGVAVQLTEKVKKHTFVPMRALFLRQVISGGEPANLSEAEATIARLKKRPSDPKDAELQALGDKQLVEWLMSIKRTSINRLRNEVVHKVAFRPTREQAEDALEEARSVLFPLTSRLGLAEDINWYVGQLGADSP